MADDSNHGRRANSSSSGGEDPTPLRSTHLALGRRSTSEAQRVRFSQDVERPAAIDSSHRDTGASSLTINTNTAGERSSLDPTKTTSQSSPTSPIPPRRRDRGYSLRRALFARGFNQQPDDDGIELQPGPSRANVKSGATIEKHKRTSSNSAVNVSPIPENELGTSTTIEGSLTSTFRKNKDSKSFGATRLPDYDSRAPKRSRKNDLTRKLKAYKKAAEDIIFRRKEIPPSKDGRHISLDASRTEDLIDERTGKGYIGNTIRSSRYTLWNFFPRQLFFQFSKLANAYFLLISILQLIPGLSTVGQYTTLAPLLVFVAFSMAKEGYDDVRRYKLDQIENKKEAQVFHSYRPVPRRHREKFGVSGSDLKSLIHPKRTAKFDVQHTDEDNLNSGHSASSGTLMSSGTLKLWSTLKWKHIKVGDIIKLERNDDVPADLVLLHATGPNGIAYIETMALDGETNLKSKKAAPCLSKRCGTIDEVAACRAHIVVEDPNTDLYNFDGRVTVEGEALPLTTNEVVFRGSTLRNTSYAIGMVINTGEDCKIRMNANKNPRIKAPAMQSITNKIIIGLVIFVVLLSLFCTIAYQIWSNRTEDKAWYLKDASVPFSQIIIGFIILYNTLIPLSLYVSLEIIKIGQLILMTDVEMYDPISNTPMVCNTTTILENLGQVGYIFSDKTGTLTDNVMRFRKLSVAGYAWLHDFDLQKDAAELEQKMNDALRKKGKGKGVAKRFHKKKRPESQDRKDSESRPPPVRRSSSIWQSSARPTKAQMEFRTEELLQFMQHKPHSIFTKKAKFFLLSLALCHTCLPEVRDNGDIEFQAASPDELALVKAAQDLGWLLIDRPSQSIILRYPGRSDSSEMITETYEVLDVIEFSSKRKRMSIIVRFPNGKICVFCKGADSAILPRLRLAPMALQKLSEVARRNSQRKNLEVEEAIRRMSEHSPRGSCSWPNMATSRPSIGRKSTGGSRPSIASTRLQPIQNSIDSWLDKREHEKEVAPDDTSAYDSARSSMYRDSFASSGRRYSSQDRPFDDDYIDDAIALDESAVFDRCFQHVDDFATEGLRTLLFGHRFLEDQEYASWKKIFADATTSLVDRQNLIENAGEMIEQNFELTGATAIEDKLQKGVPETVDKLRRANIKIWMLTGDKRETAINIAHSARVCKIYSEVIILDSTAGDVENRMTTALIEINQGNIAHSVVVIDGQTLSEINAKESLALLFFDLAVIADSVICCRASPSQKASLVKKIRTEVKNSITLAIGDGANDIAMIQEAHVGVGVSGKEGLQAARISDYSIAQFRFLQRLLLVHGRWNYVRTGKYILATFWKELLFYMVQALYQKWNGYTGTSLFESTSLTVFNTLFTSLAVIFLGIFEQDLDALTLLAVPELYTYGQRGLAFNFKKYVAWMFMAASEAMMIYFCMWGLFDNYKFQDNSDLLSIGTLCFAAAVIFINIKCLVLEMHNKTIIPLCGWLITVGGWWLWTVALSGLYKATNKTAPLYNLHHGFISHFGRDLAWWCILLLSIASVTFFELGVSSVRKTFWPTDTDVFQVLQKDPAVRKRFEETLKRENQSMNGVEAAEVTREAEQEIREGEIQELLNRPRVMTSGVEDVVKSPVEVRPSMTSNRTSSGRQVHR